MQLRPWLPLYWDMVRILRIVCAIRFWPTHGIDCHDATVQHQGHGQFQKGLELVGPTIHPVLSSDYARRIGSGVDQVQGEITGRTRQLSDPTCLYACWPRDRKTVPERMSRRLQAWPM